jgi:sulfonate transport system permease protein
MHRHDRMRAVAVSLVLLALWEFAGRRGWIADGALPAPSAVLVQLWHDRADYPPQVFGTLRTALAGFVIGNGIAILAAVLFVWCRPVERMMAGVNMMLFAMPPIALTPILLIALRGDAPRVVLAALSVYYPTMAATALGMTQVDERLCDVVRVYGGGELAVSRWVRVRSGFPAMLAGLRVAAPNAVLGSLLAEFGGGGHAGLGAYLIGSLGRGDPARLWGIGLIATAISAAGYLVFSLTARAFAGDTLSATVSLGVAPRQRSTFGVADIAIGAIAVCLPVLLWWLCIVVLRAFDISPIVLRTPVELVTGLVSGDNAADARAALLQALAQTVPYCIAGMSAGLAFALLLAVLGNLIPSLDAAMLPVSLVSQSMPLVALTPLIVLVFGRDTAAILAITISVTFFPAYVTISQGLKMVPQTAIDLVRCYGGARGRTLRMVVLPWSLPYLCTAARLSAPRAFLGVMIAEWLATGTGIGNLLNESRGMLDYGMIWNVAVTAVVIALCICLAVRVVERRMLRRFAAHE